MRPARLVPLVLAGAAMMLAGCPQEAQITGSVDAAEVASAPAASLAGAGGAGASVRSGGARPSFASLPDRGELLAYDGVRSNRREAGHQWFPVRVSEAHALAAMATGTLAMVGPDGQPIRLRYERHVEHPDGNWTWIGRDQRGTDAILTFGDKAVFGAIPYGEAETLRLTTASGHAWLVRTDRNKLSALQQRTRDGKTGRDYMLPPTPTPTPGDGDGDGIAAAAASVSGSDIPATVMAQTTIDVLLGYTTGFANMLGGTSQAVTRLNFIIQVGNQAFANSSVPVTLRLVGTQQVSYTDNSSNQSALEQLSGSDGSAPGNVPVPAALQPLRQAREQLGADLVSLVRRFRDPEHDGCGIAWLIGGAQTPITSNFSPYGYSVVSDSQGNQFPDNGHFCRDEALVHEIGHNMGSQHDRAAAQGDDGVLDPDEYGRYAYSFGHKTAAGAGNFYTVMAYGDDGQAAWRIFSNPQSTSCGGFACGITGQVDNAQSLRNTAPIIAAFRAAVGGSNVRRDVDGDGRSDLLLRFASGSTHRFGYWIMNGASVTRTWSMATSAVYHVAATGDFDGDGLLDIVWTSSARDLKLWLGSGTAFSPSLSIGTLPPGWQVFGAGDVDGDGRSDLLLQYAAGNDRRIGYWIMNGSSVTRTWSTPTSPVYSVVATGDFNADGRLDLVWTSSQRDLKLWLGNGTSFGNSLTIPSYPAGWQVVGAGDIDGDGRSDLLLRYTSPSGGRFGYWVMNANSVTRTWSMATTTAYSVAATGDYNGDGRLDLVWTSSARDLKLWLGNGTSFGSSQLVGTLPPGWSLLPSTP